MQKYAKNGDIDHNSFHNIFIISVISLLSNPPTYKLSILVLNTYKNSQIIYL